MGLNLFRHIERLRTWFEERSARERIMLISMGVAFCVLVFGLVGYFALEKLDGMYEENETARRALVELGRQGEAYKAARFRKQHVESRVPETPLELNTYVETAAATAGVAIAESSELNPLPFGRYLQRNLQIKLRRINISQLTTLITQLEQNPQYLVQITRIDVKTRYRQQEELDVKMTVSSYERDQGELEEKDRKRS